MAYLQIEPIMRGTMTKHMLNMYNVFCADEPRRAIKVPQGFEPMMALLYERHGLPAPTISVYPISLEVRDVPSWQSVVVGFSGGLDSAYMALHLKDAGFNVTLYHVTGLNKAFPDEDASARAFAQAAGMDLVECRVRHAQPQRYIDNPLKNQLIMSLMADYGLPRGIPTYAMGADWCSGIDECEIGYTITDSREVNEAFRDAMATMVPEYELVFIGDGTKKAQRLDYIAQRHPDCLPHVCSCISPHRFKRHLHDQNERKHGIRLMDGRCGSCFKCCMEWLLLLELGRVQPNAEYEAHCWDVMANGKNSHRKDLFGSDVPMAQRKRNLMAYGS